MNTAPLEYCTIDRDADDVAWLTLDMPGVVNNTLSSPLLGELETALESILAGGSPAGLVIRSGKPGGFLIGADSDELGRMLERQHAADFLRRGQRLTDRIAGLGIPTVAILHGRCRGGGLELALACRYRVAETGTSLCLPDVHLDMHPSFGGTARLADLIGATPALNLITSGREVDGETARRIGLVDAVGPAEELADTAIRLLREGPGPHRPRGMRRLLSLRPVWWLMERVRQADDKGDLSPECKVGAEAVRRLWREYGGKRPEARIRAERASALRLLREPPTMNRIRIYLLTERFMTVSRQIPAEPPRHVHLIGAGTHGAEFAVELAAKGVRVTLTDQDAERLDSTCTAARARLKQLAVVADPDCLAADPEGAGATDADVVIEAIDENLAGKQSLLAAIEPQLRPDVVLASTTSSLWLDHLAVGLARPERLIGLHFARALSEASLGPLGEVARGAQSTEEAINRGAALVAAIDRLPLFARAGPGMLVHRLLLPYILCGAGMYSRAERELIDGAGRYIGMAMGPLELADWIGLDVCLATAEALAESGDFPVPEQLREMVGAGHLGHRTGQGFHDWRGDRRVTASPAQGRQRLPEISRTLVTPALAEALRCEREGIVAEGDLIDVAGVLAAGFPAYTGGPLTWARDWQQA